MIANEIIAEWLIILHGLLRLNEIDAITTDVSTMASLSIRCFFPIHWQQCIHAWVYFTISWLIHGSFGIIWWWWFAKFHCRWPRSKKKIKYLMNSNHQYHTWQLSDHKIYRTDIIGHAIVEWAVSLCDYDHQCINDDENVVRCSPTSHHSLIQF